MDKKETRIVSENIIFLLLPSILGILVSLFFLVGLTFAWFNISIATPEQNMIAGNFDVEVSIKNIDDGSILDKVDNVYTLNDGDYEIVIRRIGTSIYSKGYANIKIGENLYNTGFINKEEDFTFQLYTDAPLTIEVTPIWSSYGLDGNNTILKDTRLENITVPLVKDSNSLETLEEDTNPTTIE